MINFKLLFASLWMPKNRQLKELEKVFFQTNQALNRILSKNRIKTPEDPPRDEILKNMNLDELRKKMAKDHNFKVSKLVDELGKEKALRQARKALFKAGLKLGEKARSDLNVGESVSDLIKAAKILYKMLGIELQIKKVNHKEVVVYVNRCTLSNYYTDSACQALSATDEGVIQGLNPHYKMRFQERITSGAPKCKAIIKFIKNRSP